MVRGLGTFSMLTEFWKVVRELNPQAIEQESTHSFRFVIAGDSTVDLGWLRDALTDGRPENDSVVVKPLGTAAEDLPTADLYIYVAKPGVRLSRDEANAIHRLDSKGYPIVLVLSPSDEVDFEEDVKLSVDLVLGTIPLHRIVVLRRGSTQDVDDKLLPALLEVAPHLHLPLARQLPRFRPLVAQQLIRETSSVNAEFAVLSSIPASIPLVGALVATGADLMVLTKNQVMMLFKLAAIHDRDLAARLALVGEIAPVVGGAFLWRSVARTLAGMLPGIIAFVPKTLVAAVGTYVVGSIALYYYQMGTRPDSHTVAQFRRDGLQGALRLLPQLEGLITGRSR